MLPKAIDLAVKRLPGWNVCVWRGFSDLVNQSEYERSVSWSQRSDVARYELLYRFGGFYLDTDVEVLRDFAPLCHHDLVVGRDPNPDYFGTAVIGAMPEHPVIGAIIRELPSSFKAGGHELSQTGPAFLTAMLRDREATVLHHNAFYPYDGAHKEFADGPFPHSYAVHRWAASWLDPIAGQPH